MMEDIWIIISTLLNQPTTLVLSLVTWKDLYIYIHIYVYIYILISISISISLCLSLPLSSLSRQSLSTLCLSLLSSLPSHHPSLSSSRSLSLALHISISERRKKASAWEKNLLYPIVMLVLLTGTVSTCSCLVLRCLRKNKLNSATWVCGKAKCESCMQKMPAEAAFYSYYAES